MSCQENISVHHLLENRKEGSSGQEMAARSEGNWNCAGKFAGARGRCVGPATLLCGSCGAVRYCSRPHQMAHWKVHREECGRMAQQMARAGDLQDFPFSFTAEATQLVDDGAVTICSFLERRHLHLTGLWHGECECADRTFTSCYSSGIWEKLNFGTGVGCTEWHLPSSMCPCRGPSESPGEWLSDWKDYHHWRKLQFDSPVALLLHWPLTVYHAIGLVLKRMEAIRRPLGSSIHVHYLGPEKELHVLQVFAELIAVLNGIHVNIDMIGPAVPVSRDGEVVKLAEYPRCSDPDCECKKREVPYPSELDAQVESTQLTGCDHLTIKLWKGLYHDRHLELSPPDIVVAPNAGIAAFPSWQPSIKLLSSSSTPTIITDYCEEAADLAARAVSALLSESLTYLVQPNPFRQPFSQGDKVLNLPTYSNGFLFGFH